MVQTRPSGYPSSAHARFQLTESIVIIRLASTVTLLLAVLAAGHYRVGRPKQLRLDRRSRRALGTVPQ